ncbi:MAG: PP2C family serine/threonine-protein phosphatase [Gemmatimonadales bacterium]
MSRRVVVTGCARTHRGKVRKENQDSFLLADLARAAPAIEIAESASGVGPVEFTLSEDGAILLVADGMGGRAGGARASALAVSSVRDAMGDPSIIAAGGDAFAARLRRALELANEEIHEQSRRDDALRGMGTTATLAGLHGCTVYFAQVGDSRGYLVRGDALARLTRDQSFVQDLIDSGVVDEEEARSIRDNRILQALGTGPSVQPEMTYHELHRGDVLLLCSDGLSRVVPDHEILAMVRASEDCLAMCERLIALANSRGGPDNITVLVAVVGGDAPGAPEGGAAPARRLYAEPRSERRG